MREELIRMIRQEDLIPAGARCLCALSGGCDSVSLLLLLSELREEKDLTLCAVHVNHGLRKAAAEDEAFCIDLCQKLRVPLAVFREDAAAFAAQAGLSVEEAGRKLRYERFLQTARDLGLDCVLTAHQRDDQAETVLFNLFRGAGLSGLCGIGRSREFAPGIRLIRPLLSFSRAELEAYLKEAGAAWREDESNRDAAYTRNFIRLELLPAVENRFPGAAGRIAQTADQLKEAEDYLEEQTERLRQETAPSGEDCLPVPLLKNAPPVLKTRLLQDLLRENGGLKDITALHYKEALAMIGRQSGGRLSLPGGRTLLREQESIRLLPQESPEDRGDSGTDVPPALSVRLFPYEKGIKIPDEIYTKRIDYAIMNDHVCLRRRADGDYFYLPGGGKKLLARYLVDEKIPLSRREKVWVLADGSHVIWAIGHRLSAAAYITEQTETVAELTAVFKEERSE